MREIKFRGKSIEFGEWLYGDLIIDVDRYAISINSKINNQSVWVKRAYEVIPESIGEYTGLKDKNGKEVYDGDSFTAKHRSGNEYKGYIQKGLSFEFVIKSYSEDFIDGEGFKKIDFIFDINSFVQYFPVDDFEVIGNAFENPSLLEQS